MRWSRIAGAAVIDGKVENPHGFGDFIRSDSLSQLLDAGHDIGEANPFGGADPFQLQPFRADAQLGHLLMDFLDALFGPMVGVDVIAITDVIMNIPMGHPSEFRGAMPHSLYFLKIITQHGMDNPSMFPGYNGQLK
jgi:hypothetical protein